ncbi:MAG TPA: MFS transporter [Polyangiales bacterium]|nr:MFS transporter [Polyangiales bacterium]
MTPLGELPVQPGLDRRWWALGFVALAQLMIALDATVVSVALPTVQRALGGSDLERAWVFSGYTLAFGSLLLLGGRISDAIGRRRAFQIGSIGFAFSSALGGAATSLAWLILARILQGVFAALLAPAALALVSLMFGERHERARAFAVFGAIAGSGGAVGLVLGGWLTESASWRWCLYVDVVLALLASLGARATLLPEPQTARQRIGSGPLVPLHILLDRNRAGAALAAALAIVAMFGLFLLLTYYFQAVRHFSPLQAGFAFLPMSAASLFGATFVASRTLPHVAPRVVLVAGLSIAAAGLAGLTRMAAGIDYAWGIVPCEIAAGFGISCAMITAISVATHGVPARQAGIASAIIATAQQLGGALGAALLNGVAARATAAYRGDHASALVHGYTVALGWGCAILVAAALAAAVLVNAPKPAAQAPA